MSDVEQTRQEREWEEKKRTFLCLKQLLSETLAIKQPKNLQERL